MIHSDTDLRIVRLIARMSFLTAEQVCRRYYKPSSYKGVQARLKGLFDAKVLLRRGWAPTLGGGSQAHVYSLAPATRSWLIARELLPKRRYRPSEDLAMKQYPAHTLAVNDVLIAAELFQGSGMALEYFLHERDIQRMTLPYKPDGYLEFAAPDKPRGVLLEVDLDSEWPEYWQRKIARMVRFVNSDAYEQTFPRFDRILVVGSDGQRTRRLQTWTEQQLIAMGADSPRARAVFAYVTLEATRDPAIFQTIL